MKKYTTSPMLTQTYYLKRLSKSKDLNEFSLNYAYLISFIQRKFWQSIRFDDPLLVIKSI